MQSFSSTLFSARPLKAVLLAGVGVLTMAASMRATVITFDDGAVVAGNTLSNQYASQGVTFAAGGGSISGVINPAITTQGFATNTNLLIDGTLESGVAAPLSGLVLRTLNGWLAEDGDAVFTMNFSSAVAFLSIDFGSNASTQGVIFAVNPLTGTATTVGSTVSTTVNGTVTATNIPAGAKTFVIVPGNYGDYVAIDNINFTAVPEPSTLAVSVLGVGLLGAWLRRRRCAA